MEKQTEKQFIRHIDKHTDKQNRTLFVGNIAEDVSKDELYEQFRYFGNIMTMNFLQNKGIAFVKMYAEDDAHQAQVGLNGIELRGRRIRVKEAKHRKAK